MGFWDDVTYVTILLCSIGLGKLLRLVPPEVNNGETTFRLRKLLSTFLGITIASIVSGWHILHLIVQISVNSLVLKILGPRFCHIASLCWCFFYLFVFRLSLQLGLPSPPPHTNAIIMIMTLKLVGLAFEVHDSAMEKNKIVLKTDKDGDKEIVKEDITAPTFEDQIHYCMNHVGLIAGPYYKYSTWKGMTCDPWNPAVNGFKGVCEKAALARLRRVPLYVAAFLLSEYLFPLSLVESQEWQGAHGLLYKIFYMAPIFFTFRMRIYAGFSLSEVVCIMAGLGSYPVSSKPRPGQGPTITPVQYTSGDEVNFEAVHNIDEWGTDFVPSMREALKCWNMTVQHWLVLVVYKRFPLKALRTVAVLFVSSIWHGVHPGYYLGLCSVPLCLVVEDLWRAKVRARLSTKGQIWYDWFGWFVRMRWFDYLGMAFLLLRIDATLTYWSSVYFCGHISLLLLFFLLQVMNPILDRVLPKKIDEDKKEN